MTLHLLLQLHFKVVITFRYIFLQFGLKICFECTKFCNLYTEMLQHILPGCCTCVSPLDESVPDLAVGPDSGREEGLGTMEYVHQNGVFSFLQVVPYVVDVCHHVLHNGCMCMNVHVHM